MQKLQRNTHESLVSTYLISDIALLLFATHRSFFDRKLFFYHFFWMQIARVSKLMKYVRKLNVIVASMVLIYLTIIIFNIYKYVTFAFLLNFKNIDKIISYFLPSGICSTLAFITFLLGPKYMQLIVGFQFLKSSN